MKTKIFRFYDCCWNKVALLLLVFAFCFISYSSQGQANLKDITVREYATFSIIEMRLSSLEGVSYDYETTPNNILNLTLNNVSLGNFNPTSNITTNLIKSVQVKTSSQNSLIMEVLLAKSNLSTSTQTDDAGQTIYLTISEKEIVKPDNKSQSEEEANKVEEETESINLPKKFTDAELNSVSLDIPIDKNIIEKIPFLKEILKADGRKDYEKAYDVLSIYIKNYNDAETLKYCLYLLADTHYKMQTSTEIKETEQDLQQTINLFRVAIEGAKDEIFSPWALMRIIKCYRELKLDSDAIRTCEELITDYPDSQYVPMTMLIKAEMLAKKKDLQSALGICNEVKDKYQRTIWEIEAGYYTGDLYYWNDEWVNAYNQYDKLLTINKQLAKNNPGRYYRIADTFFINENWDRAREVFISLYKTHTGFKKNDLVLAHIGDTYNEQGDKLRSLRYYQKVVVEYPETEGAYSSMIRLADAGFKDLIEGTVDKKLYYDAYQNPIESYKTVVVNKVSAELSQVALFKLGEAYSKMGDYLGSIAALDALIKKYPKTPLADNARQIIVSIMKEAVDTAYEKENYFLITEYFGTYGEKRYEELKDPTFLKKVADAFYYMEFYPEALRLYNDLFALTEDKAETTTYKWIECSYCCGDVDEALTEAEKFKIYNNQSKNIFDIYHILGDVYRSKGCFFRSNKYYELCLDQSEPFEKSLATRINIARNYMDLKQPEKAIEAYNEALLIFEKCREDYSKCRDVAEILFNLGENLFELEEYQKSIRAYDEFLTIFPEDKRKFMANYKIGKAYLNLDQYSDAKKHFSALYDQYEDDFWRKIAYNALDELKLKEQYSYIYNQ